MSVIDWITCWEQGFNPSDADVSFIGKFDAASGSSVELTRHVSLVLSVINPSTFVKWCLLCSTGMV